MASWAPGAPGSSGTGRSWWTWGQPRQRRLPLTFTGASAAGDAARRERARAGACGGAQTLPPSGSSCGQGSSASAATLGTEGTAQCEVLGRDAASGWGGGGPQAGAGALQRGGPCGSLQGRRPGQPRLPPGRLWSHRLRPRSEPTAHVHLGPFPRVNAVIPAITPISIRHHPSPRERGPSVVPLPSLRALGCASACVRRPTRLLPPGHPVLQAHRVAHPITAHRGGPACAPCTHRLSSASEFQAGQQQVASVVAKF